jgi:hypothetical protein
MLKFHVKFNIGILIILVYLISSHVQLLACGWSWMFYSGLGGGQTRDGHAEGRAAHVLKPRAVAAHCGAHGKLCAPDGDVCYRFSMDSYLPSLSIM